MNEISEEVKLDKGIDKWKSQRMRGHINNPSYDGNSRKRYKIIKF